MNFPAKHNPISIVFCNYRSILVGFVLTFITFALEMAIVDVIIPAYNEEKAIALVINDIPKDLVRNIIVCNNNSKDKTAEVAQKSGAIVVHEKRSGYGYACLKGMDYVRKETISPDIIVFVDGDHSDYADQMSHLIDPILTEGKDLVIGSRALGHRQKGSMTIPQEFGNWLATLLIRIIYKYRFTDLGPFRAIKYRALIDLDMQDKTYGWTVEMQVKAAKQKLSCTEIPVDYRQRIGVSKVSGTIKGTILAGYKIIWTIFKLI